MADEKLTDEALIQIINDARLLVELRSVYRHIKTITGGQPHEYNYVVDDIVLRENDLEPLVIYAPTNRTGALGIKFSRPVSEFVERFRLINRFTGELEQ